MSPDAVRFCGFSTSQDVLVQRDWFQVSWIDTLSNPAQMVKSKPSWYWTYKQFIGKTVGQMVSALADCASPKPTGISALYPAVKCFVQGEESPIRHNLSIAQTAEVFS